MVRRTDADYDWDEERSEGGEDTIACPYCRRSIHEDSVRCPHCENYLSQEDLPSGPKPWWLVVGVLVCLAVVWSWISGR